MALGTSLDRLMEFELSIGDPVESLLRLESELRLTSAGYYRCRDYGGVSCIILFYNCTSVMYVCTPYVTSSSNTNPVCQTCQYHTRSTGKY